MALMLCKIMGIIFLVVAVWGFIDGESVLGFHVNTAHNVVHLLSGIGALACGFAGYRAAKTFALVFGLVYGLVGVLGLLNVTAVVDLLHLNRADDFLHLGIAALFLVAAFLPATATVPAALK